ncbi:precorrin-6y C5,15-methyltransferase (decarboxylating) subunit CbiE [Psychromonas sp. Urea-02u-13]|uniref:precorrin-6y C5,15-methyltransferase (decarboxylating) subunit CbiE n=1 Tax=Psychromonas sp. Urea-02u-13 TaxID=2058326 RepID=UPI000C31E13B|nr:precorrin-6y C5,15-methyltransferase (decarboxylating) subunit CbiE [Psychromonas sp. Urea-02u-13]PKG40955.1 cobalamin biosynthesis bifunctional protein CbiET [Psychromonas sp. Urea-02u-13]
MQPVKIISVIGLGVAENAALSAEAISALNNAQLVIGSARQLLTLANILTTQKTAHLPKLNALKALIETASSVVVLGSGDPLYYGIGSWLSKQFTSSQLHFYPAISSITQACHSLAIGQQDVTVLSLHGRPLNKLKVALKANQTLLLLTDKHSQPSNIAEVCLETGFDQAEIIVCERLGYSDQKISRFILDALINTEHSFDALHVSFVICHQNQGYLPEFPGIKDQYFETGELGSKGMISKREVRLAILSLLQLQKEDLLWDIGAGCGGVSVELAYWQPKATVYAIEHHQQRFECLLKNREKFGVVSNLKPIFGRAPEQLSSLPAANKIFIGGSDGELPVLLASLWQALPEGGKIVVSAVMESTKSQLFDFYSLRSDNEDCQAETLQVAINKGATLAGQLIYRPALPVNLFSFIKRKTS